MVATTVPVAPGATSRIRVLNATVACAPAMATGESAGRISPGCVEFRNQHKRQRGAKKGSGLTVAYAPNPRPTIEVKVYFIAQVFLFRIVIVWA